MLVDVDVGLGRCGVVGPADAVELAREVERTRGLELKGIMGYEGRLRSSREGRAETIARAYGALAETKAAFDRSGLAAGTVSSAGTSTLREALADPTITEIQAGTYVLMEADLDGLPLPFVPACAVMATVISRTTDRAVLDVGRKSIACDYGPPAPLLSGAVLESIHDEHTTLRFGGDAPKLGHRVELPAAYSWLPLPAVTSRSASRTGVGSCSGSTSAISVSAVRARWRTSSMLTATPSPDSHASTMAACSRAAVGQASGAAM